MAQVSQEFNRATSSSRRNADANPYYPLIGTPPYMHVNMCSRPCNRANPLIRPNLRICAETTAASLTKCIHARAGAIKPRPLPKVSPASPNLFCICSSASNAGVHEHCCFAISIGSPTPLPLISALFSPGLNVQPSGQSPARPPNVLLALDGRSVELHAGSGEQASCSL